MLICFLNISLLFHIGDVMCICYMSGIYELTSFTKKVNPLMRICIKSSFVTRGLKKSSKRFTYITLIQSSQISETEFPLPYIIAYKPRF